MAKLKDGTRIYGNVTIDSAAAVTTVNASTVNASSYFLSNGVEDGSNSDTGTFYGSDPGDAELGGYEDGNYLNGRIGLGLVYNRALDAGEISTIFESIRGRFGI